MAKKLSLLMAAAAVLAFTVPAMASAAPEVTFAGGEKAGQTVPVNTTITLTGTDVILTDSTVGNTTCGTLNLTGNVAVNNPTNGWTITSINQFTSANCINPNGTVVITSFELTDLKATVSGTVTASFRTFIDLGTKFKCTFTGTNVTGAYTPGTDTLTFTDAAGISGVGCGTAKLDGSFTMEVGSSPVISS